MLAPYNANSTRGALNQLGELVPTSFRARVLARLEAGTLTPADIKEAIALQRSPPPASTLQAHWPTAPAEGAQAGYMVEWHRAIGGMQQELEFQPLFNATVQAWRDGGDLPQSLLGALDALVRSVPDGIVGRLTTASRNRP